MDALEVLDNLNKLDVIQTASEAAAEVAPVMADLNATQLSQGIRSDGSKTTPSYKQSTIDNKQGLPGLSGVTDRVTLYDTGDFYRGLYADVQGEDVTFGSTDRKEAKLDMKYSKIRGGGSIFGLTEESREELIVGHLQREWEARVENITGLPFE